MTYSELLQDPRWDEKRKEILKRDDLTCQECKITDVTLQVHHHFYHPNTMPWDYDNDVLITLCEPCHLQEEFLKSFDSLGFQYLLTMGLTRNKVSQIIQAIGKRLDKADNISIEFAYLINSING